MAKAKHKYDFTVDFQGKTYQCERTVEGTRVLTQDLHVKGIGDKSDTATYGQRGHRISSMEGIAKVLAVELIIESQKKKS